VGPPEGAGGFALRRIGLLGVVARFSQIEWVEMLEFDVRVGGCELPIGFGVVCLANVPS
jgi:hypothetical protein